MQGKGRQFPSLFPARAGNRWVIPVQATGLAVLLQQAPLLGTQACQLPGVEITADANELHRIGGIVWHAARRLQPGTWRRR